jgi:hypothetical protein
LKLLQVIVAVGKMRLMMKEWLSMSDESRVSIVGELSLSRILGNINTIINAHDSRLIAQHGEYRDLFELK